MNVTLLIIDPQVDFHPGGSLGIDGANEDSERIANLIKTLGGKISRIVITLDSHHRTHVAHGISWTNEAGEHPAPFTLISHSDVVAGTWKAANPKRQKAFSEYTEKLEAKGRFKVIVWPEHCLIGTPGHAVVPSINSAAQEWAGQNMRTIRYVWKGENLNTEMYSAMAAEVPVPNDKSTHLNQELVSQLNRADKVIICGQALSHCVNFTTRDIIENWKHDMSDLVLLTDGTSPVAGFQSSADEFVAFCREKGVLLHDTVSLVREWDTFTPRPKRPTTRQKRRNRGRKRSAATLTSSSVTAPTAASAARSVAVASRPASAPSATPASAPSTTPSSAPSRTRKRKPRSPRKPANAGTAAAVTSA